MDLTDRLASLSPCQLSDGLGKLGLDRRGLGGIEALEPMSRIVGRAFTVTFSTLDDVDRRIEYIDQVSPGDVIVLGNGGRLDCSVWGGQRSVGAIQRGAVATICDGAYRDIDDHRRLGYPVFGRARTLVASLAGAVPVATGEHLTVGGIAVSPGDYIVGDASGVIVLPQHRAAEVVAVTEQIRDEENTIEAAVAAGDDFTRLREVLRGPQ